MKKKGFYWHVHHDILLEWCWDYDERVKAIKDKPKHEIETRLKLFQPVKGELPQEVVESGQKWNEAYQKQNEAEQKWNEAYQKLDEAGQKWDEAGQKWDEAGQKLVEVLIKHKPFLEKLHKKECGCREWNGKEIVFEAQIERRVKMRGLNLGQGEKMPSCEIRTATTFEGQLREEKERLGKRLKDVNAVLEALAKAPEVKNVLEALNKLGY